jgi:hypothetical protein
MGVTWAGRTVACTQAEPIWSLILFAAYLPSHPHAGAWWVGLGTFSLFLSIFISSKLSKFEI